MRNIIYKDLGIVVPKDGSSSKIYENVSRETYLLDILTEYLERSRADKAEYFIAFTGLRYMFISIVNYLHKMGYGFMPEANKTHLHVKEFRLRMTSEHCFFIQVKTGSKSFVTFQATETVIGLQRMPSTIDELDQAQKLYHYTRDKFLDGVHNAETRMLYSSASISRTMFNRNCCGMYEKARFRFSGCISYHGEKMKKNVFLEKWCRPAVHGGFNMVSSHGMEYHGEGIVLDANSLYPFIADACYIPEPTLIKYGDGEPERKYVKRKEYYTMMKVEVTASVKKNGIACIMKDGALGVHSVYLSRMTKRILTLTPADRKLLYSNYDIKYFRVKEYVVFRANRISFKKYIDPLYKEKTESEGIVRDYIKLMLNGFIGTFAKRVFNTMYTLEESDDGTLQVRKALLTAEQYQKNLKRCDGLCFVNAAIVSEARLYMVNKIKENYDRFLYTDTDSIHLRGYEIPENITIGKGLGEFKVEHTFTKCLYKGIKNYIIVENGSVIPTVAGMPKDTFKRLFENVPGIDYRYIRKALLKKELTKLYEKPVPTFELCTDIDTGTVSYIGKAYNMKRERIAKKRIHERFEKYDEAQRKAQKDLENYLEWRDNHEFGKMMRDSRFERNRRCNAKKRIKETIEGWAHAYFERRVHERDLNSEQLAFITNHKKEIDEQIELLEFSQSVLFN